VEKFQSQLQLKNKFLQ